jgi:5'-nucleotidase (lipoprotein e(P4) family)
MDGVKSMWWLWVGVGLMAGLLVAPKGTTTPPPVNPALRTLDANLFVQTSPEYRALCLQAYNVATANLPGLIKKAAGKPAVVLDLDETVLDNSPFQTWLFKHARTFSQERWTPWEQGKGGHPLAVPGAVEFIAAAQKAGATVFFISNRMEESRKATVEALKHLGIDVTGIDERLLLREKGKPSDKTQRRARVAKSHDIVMLVGDTLTDFSQDFAGGKVPEDAEGRRKLIAARKAKVDAAREKWGAAWVVLPNPCYGDFTRVSEADALEVMNHSTLPD